LLGSAYDLNGHLLFVHPLLEIALLPVAYAVLLLLTLQLFRFAGGLAATCTHALAMDTK
jgi:hypothetical protein